MFETPLHASMGSTKPQPVPAEDVSGHSGSTEKGDLLQSVRSVIALEANALWALGEGISDSYYHALRLIHQSKGKVILTGVGKSGLIARKIAATLNSTGTVATFLHPSDGMHGDLGVLSSDDVVIAIGKNGESEELNQILPAIKRLGAKIIALTAKLDTTLTQHSDIVLYTPIEKEACPLDLAPTVSTTVALAVGDALAMTLMKMKNFQCEDFAKYHPGGKLGKRLLLRVRDLMIRRDRCPLLNPASATL